MSAAPSLLARWKKALVFRIGENDTAGIDQLPDFRTFPGQFPCSKLAADQNASYALACVFAFAFLKLSRPWPVKPGDSVALDPCGGWLYEFAPMMSRLSGSYGQDAANNFFMTLGVVIEMALLAPDRLTVLVSRIDALDNATLHRMAVAAVQGLEYGPDLFAGLYE